MAQPPVPAPPPVLPPPPPRPQEAPLGQVTINGRIYTVEVIFKNDRGEILDIPDNFAHEVLLEETYQIGSKLQTLIDNQDNLGDLQPTKLTEKGFKILTDEDASKEKWVGLQKTKKIADEHFNEKSFSNSEALFKNIEESLIHQYLNPVNDEIDFTLDVYNTTQNIETEELEDTLNPPQKQKTNAFKKRLKKNYPEQEHKVWNKIAKKIQTNQPYEKEEIITLLKGMKFNNTKENYYDRFIIGQDENTLISRFVSGRIAALDSNSQNGNAIAYDQFSYFNQDLATYLDAALGMPKHSPPLKQEIGEAIAELREAKFDPNHYRYSKDNSFVDWYEFISDDRIKTVQKNTHLTNKEAAKSIIEKTIHKPGEQGMVCQKSQ